MELKVWAVRARKNERRILANRAVYDEKQPKFFRKLPWMVYALTLMAGVDI
jgi:hypothetical protein